MGDVFRFMIDTHCHLDSAVFKDDLESVINKAYAKNVQKIIIPGADIKDLPSARQIASIYKDIFFAAGCHPDEIESFDKEILKSYAKDRKCVAIGECGLDYYRLPTLKDYCQQGRSEQEFHQAVQKIKSHQESCFRAQIELSIELDKPLIVHIREASNDSFKILQDYPKARGVLHCYNADQILLELKDRFYYGIGGVCTFKNARRLIEVLPLIPKERILLETDAPYLTPHPFRGQRNEPCYIPLIMAKIAEVLGQNEQNIIHQSTSNALELFKELQ